MNGWFCVGGTVMVVTILLLRNNGLWNRALFSMPNVELLYTEKRERG